MALLPSLSSQILEKYQVERITQELQAIRTEKRAKSGDAASEISVSLVPAGSESVASLASTSPADSQTKLSKTQLWKELKIQSLTRAIVLVYCSSLLVFFTRLQLNILGRKNYVLSVIQLADGKPQEDGQASTVILDQEDLTKVAMEEQAILINRMYLTFSWWLLNKGWITLAQRIEDSVTKVFGDINPRADLTLQEFSNLLGQVQFEIDHPTNESGPSNFLTNLLPPTELESYVLAQAPSNGISGPPQEEVTAPLRRLLDETADFIESPNAVDVIQKTVHAGLSVLVQKISSIYPSPQIDSSQITAASVLTAAQAKDASAVAVTAPGSTAKLASISASASRQAHILSGGSPLEPNEYISAMISVPELDGFSALVYSNFDWSSLEDKAL